jgi:hypothetical protein
MSDVGVKQTSKIRTVTTACDPEQTSIQSGENIAVRNSVGPAVPDSLLKSSKIEIV